MAEALPDNSNSDFSDDEELTSLDICFNKASEHVRKITSKLDNNQLLEIYGLYKQSTEGKCETAKPGWFDGKGRRKWEAWRALDEMPKEEAKQKYVELVKKYDSEFEIADDTKKGPKESWVAVSTLRGSESELAHEEMTIFEAARENSVDRLKELLEKNPACVNDKDEDGLTALHWAADRDSTLVLTFLLNAGCEINATDNYGQTALHYAAGCGHVQSTKLLLNAGALMTKDSDGSSPLDLADDEKVWNVLNCASS